MVYYLSVLSAFCFLRMSCRVLFKSILSETASQIDLYNILYNSFFSPINTEPSIINVISFKMLKLVRAHVLIVTIIIFATCGHAEQYNISDYVEMIKAPYFVPLFHDGWSHCSGALIGDDLVLTAASCVMSPVSAATLKIKVGGANGKPVAVKNITIHPLYKDGGSTNDIALVRLQERVTLSDAVQIVALADALNTDDNIAYLIVRDRTIKIEIHTGEYCSDYYKDEFRGVSICAKMLPYKQVAQGSPVVNNGKLIGFVTYGISPILITKVPLYRNWIDLISNTSQLV